MNKLLKQKIIQTHRTHTTDTGSDQVQTALLKSEIAILSAHLKVNKKDIVCRRILLKKVAKFKKFSARIPESSPKK